MYNLEVENFHTYFIGKNGVWVHNECQFTNKTTKRFIKDLKKLPKEIQEKAKKQYELFKKNPTHPSLNFEKLSGFDNVFSARIDKQYREYGQMKDGVMEWFHVGPHDYDTLKQILK